MSEQFANQALTTLAAELAKGATTLTVASTARFPAKGNFRILIDSELLMVTVVEGTTFTVERGIEETTDIAHASGSAVTQVLTAGGLANKADLDEGALRESELPGSAVTASELPAIYASRHGVAAANTGEANSEALAAAIVEAEEHSISRILLPSGTIALDYGFLLNKADDEGGRFQYIIQGDGRGTTLDLDAKMDWLFRVNCTEADEATHETPNLIGRLQLRDLMVIGTEVGSTGLARVVNCSVQMDNVRGLHLDYGVYQVSGYCDHHAFENVRWNSESTEHGWLLYMASSNGDGHIFRGISAGASRVAYLNQSFGALIEGCINGIYTFRRSSAITVNSHHWESFAPSGGEGESPAPAFTIKDSRVHFGPGYFLAGTEQPIVEINDEQPAWASQVTFMGTGFGWILGQSGYQPPRSPHLHITEARGGTRIIFDYPRCFITRHGASDNDPIGLYATSDGESLQEALDNAPELLNGHSMLQQTGGAWELKSIGRRTGERQTKKPAITSIGQRLEEGGAIANETTYHYRIAVWDGFQWSDASDPAEKKAEAGEAAFALSVSLRTNLSKIRVWRGPTSGEYDRYIDLPVPVAFTVLTDQGDFIAGLPWITEGTIPTTPTGNGQYDVEEVNGRIVGSTNGKPTTGEWSQGDFMANSEPYEVGPEGGKYVILGWLCTEGGTSPTWVQCQCLTGS